MIEIIDKKNCCGCWACVQQCPKQCISMIEDDEGFLYPKVDKGICINCHLCEYVCPIINTDAPRKPLETYAAINKDEQIRLESSSGGIFSAIAEYIINDGGVVFGAKFNDKWEVIHDYTETIDGLAQFRGSKYVQSQIGDNYKKAKQFLTSGRKVLFSGTPCQIAGLKSYLKKDYENLVTIDLICHGVPSPLILEKYKQEFLQNNPNEKIININFRSKLIGWNSSHTITDIYTNIKLYSLQKINYMKAFLYNAAINTSCLDCQFNKIPRIADITIGDFWGVDEYDKSLNDKNGLSIILINNEKGQNLLNKIDEICKLQEVPLDVATKRNPNIYSSSKAHKNREEFLDYVCIKNKTLKSGVQKYIKTPIYIVIYRLLPQFMKDFIKYKIMKMGK